MGREFLDDALAVSGTREARERLGLCRPADPAPPRCRPAVSLRQRPPGEGQAPDRRRARGLRRPHSARASPAACAVRCAAAARGRRQRAPCEGRGALPRCGPRALAHRQRARGRAARSRPPRLGRRRRGDARRDEAATSCPSSGRAAAILAPRLLRIVRARRSDAGAVRGVSPHQAPTRAPMPRRSPRPCSTGRSAPPARNCTRPTSWRRRATSSSSSTSTPRTSAWSTSA